MKWPALLHVLSLSTLGVEIQHHYDSASATFAEEIKNAICLLIQDFQTQHLVIEFKGPNMTPALESKNNPTCTHGGVNYANLLQNFQAIHI